MTEKRFELEDIGFVYDNGTLIGMKEIVDCLNALNDENEQLKEQLFETSKELLWATSDEVDRVLYYEDEVEELRKEIFE